MINKALLYFRHLDPNESEEKTLKRLTSLKDQPFSTIFVGPEERTTLTAELFVKAKAAMCSNPTIPAFEQIEQIGNDALFGKMFTGEVFEALGTGRHNILTAFKTVHGEAQLKSWTADALEGIFTMFERTERAFAVAFGHNPIIPMAASVLLGGYFIDIAPLECLVFTQDDRGEVRVALDMNPYLAMNPYLK